MKFRQLRQIGRVKSRTRKQLILSDEERQLITRAWPFEAIDRENLSKDLLRIRKQVLSYYGLNDRTRLKIPQSISDLLEELDAEFGIRNLTITGSAEGLSGDSGLLIASYPDGLQLIKPSGWLGKQKPKRIPLQTTMLFHTLPNESASVGLLLERIVQGRLNQLLLIICVALLAVLISLGPTWLQSYIFNEIVPNGQKYLMVQIAVFLLFIKMTANGLKLFNQFIGLRLELYLSLTTTALLVDRLLRLKEYYFKQYNVGDLQQRVNSAHALRKALQQSFVTTITSLFVVLLNIVLIYFQTHSLELCLLLLLASLLGPGVDAIAATIETLLRVRRLTLTGKLQDDVLSPLESIQTVRAIGLERDVARQFADTRSKIARIDVHIGLIKTSLSALTLCLNASVISFLFYIFSSDDLLTLLGDGLDSSSGQPSQGLVVLLLSAFSTINGAIRSLSRSTLSLMKVIPDTLRFRPLIRATNEDNKLILKPICSLAIKLRSDVSPQPQQNEIELMPGNTVAIIANPIGTNNQAINNKNDAKTVTARSYSSYSIIINGNLNVESIADLLPYKEIRLVTCKTFITPGTLLDNITEYASNPRINLLNTCLNIIQVDPNQENLKQEIDPLVDADPIPYELGLRIMIARTLYAQPRYIFLRNILDQLPIEIAANLCEYTKHNKISIVMETSRHEIAKLCDIQHTSAVLN